MRNPTIAVAAKIPVGMLERMREHVKAGEYVSLGDLVRSAVREKLDRIEGVAV